MRYQAVVFDLDGVITDTAKYHFQAWAQLANELGIPFTEQDNEGLKGLSREESLDALLKLGGLQISSPEKVQLAARKNKMYVELISDITPADILPGIRNLIDTLRQQDTPLALASASKNASAVMKGLRLTDEFTAIVDAATVANSKPHPEVFLRAADMLGVDPRSSIGIEDAVHGITAVKSANMYAVAIGRSDLFPHADIVFEDTQALADSDLFKERA